MKKVEHVGALVQERTLVRSKEFKGLSVSRCFKFRSKIGMETAIQALRSAHREKRATMDELWRAAKVCRELKSCGRIWSL
jgi:hypothetical protein